MVKRHVYKRTQQLPTTRNNMRQDVQGAQHVTSQNYYYNNLRSKLWPTIVRPFASGFILHSCFYRIQVSLNL